MDANAEQPDALSVEALSFRYPARPAPALSNVGFRLRAGESVLILGPSGSGKSTLALALNGLIPHAVEGEAHGRVLLRGMDTRTYPVARLSQEAGLMFQDPDAQFCCLTAEEEVAFGPENLCVPAEEVRARAHDALRTVGLWHLKDARIDHLSGGQKQRLAAACALAMHASVLICDEPTANLDPSGARELLATLARLGKHGTSLVIIEHRLDDVLRLVDSAVVLDAGGNLVAAGGIRDELAGRADELHSAGVWLPFATELGVRLRRIGCTVPELPLTIEEAVEMLPKPSGDLRLDLPTCPAPRGTELAVRVANLSFRYEDGTQALEDVSIEVFRGEFAAVIGPNGSGKSTLGLALFGALAPQRGTVEVCGKPVSKLTGAELRQCIGYVFQNPEHQFVADSVRAELAYGLEHLGLSETEIERRVRAALDRFRLSGLEALHPYRLSQGQKRRLSVAAMLTGGQQVLVLDEPTFGQDRETAESLMGSIEELNAGGVTVLMVTHDMGLVARYAHRVVVLVGGRLVFTGSPRELFARPDLLEAAGLEPPPALVLSRALQARYGGYPDAITMSEHVHLLAATK